MTCRDKDTKDSLLKQGLIKKCPVDDKTIFRLIKRAHVDIKTARRNINIDEECAYNYAYNAMLRSGLALMFSFGYRPEIKDKHLTIVRFSGSVLGEEYKRIVDDYDFMRRKRNKFIYEPDIPCSRQEAGEAIKTAEEYISKISKLVRKQMPQREFDF